MIHGLGDHKLYYVWISMKYRCYNKNHPSYHNYGGRGISVCDEWMKDVKTFYDFAIENGWKEGLEIDRINNDGNYEPSNIRFVSHRKNNLNTRKQKNNTSGYVGVYFDKARNKWQARLKIYRKEHNLGRFENKEDAVQARNQYIIDNNLKDDYKIQEIKKDNP